MPITIRAKADNPAVVTDSEGTFTLNYEIVMYNKVIKTITQTVIVSEV